MDPRVRDPWMHPGDTVRCDDRMQLTEVSEEATLLGLNHCCAVEVHRHCDREHIAEITRGHMVLNDLDFALEILDVLQEVIICSRKLCDGELVMLREDVTSGCLDEVLTSFWGELGSIFLAP